MTGLSPPSGPQDERSLNLGQELRAARRRAGWSLRELGARLGISPSFLSQIENGKAQPSVTTLYALAKVLHLSIDAMFDSASEETTPLVDPSSSPVSRRAAMETARHEEGGSRTSANLQDLPAPHLTVETRSTGSSLYDRWALSSHLSLTKPGHRLQLVMDNGVTWDQLALNSGHGIDFMEITYPPGSSTTGDDSMMQHDGVEYGYLMEGELEVTIGSQALILTAGDALGLDSSIPHLFRNHGAVPARGIWLVHHHTSV